MSALFDIIIAAAFLGCLAMGYRRGFVRSVMSVLSFVIAFAAARAFAPRLADYLHASHVQPRFLDSAVERIGGFLTANIDLSRLAGDANPPADFVNMIRGYGFDMPDVRNWVNAGGGADYVAANLAEPVARQFSYFLAFGLIFVAALILLKIAVKIIDGVLKLPGLNLINKLGGVAVGLIYGAALCFILVFLASYALPYLEANGVISSWENIKDGTIFFRWFYDNSPI